MTVRPARLFPALTLTVTLAMSLSPGSGCPEEPDTLDTHDTVDFAKALNPLRVESTELRVELEVQASATSPWNVSFSSTASGVQFDSKFFMQAGEESWDRDIFGCRLPRYPDGAVSRCVCYRLGPLRVS